MKVLLLGEFSALHKNLAEGLSHLGIDVTTASSGDGTKAISSDLSWAGKRVGKAGKIERLFNLSKVYKEFKGYDVVQLISPCIFPKELGINKRIMKYVINNNKKIYLVGAGGSTVNTILANFFRNSYKYPQLYQEIVKKTGDKWCFSPTGRRFNKYLHDSITGYIPIMYEYAEPYREIAYSKLCQTIPIPINIDSVKYEPNIVKGKVSFFHGVTREGEKGTPLIRAAMEILKKKYPNEVEINIVGNLPLSEYLEVTSRANVIIDQVYSVSYGMNTAYNLALGKVCIGGGEDECLNEFSIAQSPIISIDTNVQDIVTKMEWVLDNKHIITDIGADSREYAENLHSHIVVAQQYLKVWRES